jgi:hypothetical protein
MGTNDEPFMRRSSEAQSGPDRRLNGGSDGPRKEGTVMPTEISTEIHTWPIDKLVFYARNPRKNDWAVDRMCASIQEFGFKIPCLVRSDGEVIDGHLRLKAARKLGISDIPAILCDEWTPAQVKAFRLMVNRSATWADWDEELLAVELMDLQTADYDLALTGFDTKELDALILNDAPDEDAVPPVPVHPVSRVGDRWLCGSHRVLCGDATDPEAVSRLLGDQKPFLMVVDPPYGIELDSEWRDRANLNKRGPAEPSYLQHRTKGHQETVSPATRARTGRKHLLWFRVSKSGAYGMRRSSRARFSTVCCGSASFIISKLSGIRDERSSPGPTTGFNTSPAGTFARRMFRGTGSLARTRPSGMRRRRSSSWVAVVKTNSIIRRRSRSS